LAHYEEKLTRASSRPPTTAELRSQLIRLKSDLEHFQISKASAGLVTSLKERIRQVEAQLAQAAPKPARPQGPAEQPDATAPLYATQARYAARPRR
jgi:hypothetical protein